MLTIGNGTLRRFMHGTPVGTGPNNVKGSLFIYATTDAAATVEAANFFNPATALLTVGDVILMVVGIGGTQYLKAYVVATNAAGVVALALQKVTAG